MNELIMPHNAGVKRVLESMKEVLALYRNVTGNYRPLLDGELQYDRYYRSWNTEGVHRTAETFLPHA